MKLQDLLRHIADNVENGSPWYSGLDVPEHYATFQDVWINHHSIKLATRTHMVNGFEVPAPESEALTRNNIYYIPDASNLAWYVSYTWVEDEADKRFLVRRLVHLTKESAIANAKAEKGIDPYSESE